VSAAGGVGAGTLLLGGGEVAADTHATATTRHPRWLLTVDEAALPEAPVPADARVVHAEGPDGLLTLEQLQELDSASVVRDAEGDLRVVDGDWRTAATTADRVGGLPGLVAVEPAGEHTFLVETDLAPDQLAGLPGVVAVATEDGSPPP
jgi:hypothetical protein